MTAMAHLTCAAHTRDQLAEIVTRYARRRHREHPRPGRRSAEGPRPPAGRAHARDRSRRAWSASIGDFSVGVAAHPEPHPRSESRRVRPSPHRREAARGRLRDHAVLLRRPALLRPRREPARARRRQAGDRRDHAGHEPRLVKRMAEMQGSEFPAWLAEKLARGRRRPRGGAQRRRRGGHEALPGAARRRRARGCTSTR